MNDFAFIFVAVISGIFGLIGLQLMQQNWFKREDLKYRYDVKRAKLRKKNVPVKATSTPSSPLDWISIIKKLDPDMVHNFVDVVSGGSPEYADEEGAEGIEGMIGKALNVAKNNPELAQTFIDGLNKGKGGQQEQQIVR